jgi:DNA-binding NarL/FixJ family response regulator
MRSIILADNQYISQSGWKYILEHKYDNCNLFIITNKNDLIKRIVEFPESLVILDYTIFDFESVNDLIILQSRFNKTDWIIFSNEISYQFLQNLLFNTHCFSVLLKNSTLLEVESALNEAMIGNRFICNQVSNILLDNSRSLQSSPIKQLLTTTEIEILKELAMGKTTKEIASKRFVSVHTIMTHRKNIFKKVDVNNVHEATKYAMKAGIVDMAEYYI